MTKLRLELQTDAPTGQTRLKAEIAVVSKKMERGAVKPLSPQSSSESQNAVRLSVELTELTPKDIDHLVLVVSNCGCRAAQRCATHPPNDD